MVTLEDVYRARRRIAPYVLRTPLVDSGWLSSAAGVPVSLKVETLQPSGSFKLRGAYNAVLARRERQDRLESIVTASAGNHGRALAAAAERFGIRLIVFTPKDAAAVKLEAIRRHGAELRAEGQDYDDAERTAKAYARESGMPFVSPYSDVDVIAGAATTAVEIVEDAPAIDTFVVPIGGGGLISGVAVAAKAIAPRCRVIGVEVEASHPFQTSVRAGRLVEIVPRESLADGLVGNPDPETITFDYIQRLVDDIVVVAEDQLRDAMRGLIAKEHLIVEGAGGVGVAAVLAGAVNGAHVATILTGSNIDEVRIRRILS